MKTASVRLFTVWWVALFALLLAACGSDNNPVTPTTAGLNQVTALNSTVPDNIFSATVSGSEETPAVTTKATATAAVIVDLNTRQMKATVVTSDITATGVNAHEGIKGVNGAEVIPFTETSPGSGVWTAAAILTVEQLEKLKTGNYYINAKSAAFPDGEIRGQVLAQLPKSGSAISTVAISAAGSTSTGTTVSQTATGSTTSPTATTITGATGTTPATTTTAGTSVSTSPTSTTGSAVTAATTDNLPLFFTNIMSGSLVIPSNSSSASAIAISLYKPADKSLTSVLVSTGMTGTAANIRQAAADATGPVVGSLTQTAANSGIWTARNTLNDDQVKALSAGNMYYEILSAAFPNGEIRGQIVKTKGASKVSPVASTTTSATTGTTAGVTTPVSATPAATTPAATTPATTSPVATGSAETTPATTTAATTTGTSTETVTPASTTATAPDTTSSSSGTTSTASTTPPTTTSPVTQTQ